MGLKPVAIFIITNDSLPTAHCQLQTTYVTLSGFE